MIVVVSQNVVVRQSYSLRYDQVLRIVRDHGAAGPDRGTRLDLAAAAARRRKARDLARDPQIAMLHQHPLLVGDLS